MTLTDILSKEQWEELEREIVERFGLNASVQDEQGGRITGFDNYCNALCRRIKTDPKGVSAICSVAAQYFASQARETAEPLTDECDAGMTKIAVPVVVDGEVLGTVGCCGVLVDDGEVDDFMVALSLGVDEAELAPCMDSIPRMSAAQADEVRTWLAERVERILSER